MGASPVLADDEAEPVAFDLAVSVPDGKEQVEAGTKVPVTISVKAPKGTVTEAKVTVLSVTTSTGIEPIVTPNRCIPLPADGCKIDADGDTLNTSVSVSPKLKKITKVTFSITVKGKDAKDETLTSTYSAPVVTYTPIKDDEPDETKPPKPPTSKPPKPSPTPTKPKPKPSPTKTENDDNNSGSGGSGNNGGGNSNSGNNNTSNNNSTYTPPSPNSNPQVALPPIQQAPSPSVAPNVTPTPESRLRNNKAPIAQDLTFERMASTQIAWLAALMVAFSLLMTQLRLGRPRNAAAAARAKGAHRRPKRGTFGK